MILNELCFSSTLASIIKMILTNFDFNSEFWPITVQRWSACDGGGKTVNIDFDAEMV